MGYFVSRDNSYHEGDEQSGDTSVPQRPDSTYDWDGTKWVVNAARAARVADGLQLLIDLGNVKSIPAVVTLIKMTPAQIDTYMAANVTTLAQARDILASAAKVLAVIARNQIANGA
jgi:hypothetical protein